MARNDAVIRMAGKTPTCGNCDSKMRRPQPDDVGYNTVKWMCDICGTTIPPLETLGVEPHPHDLVSAIAESLATFLAEPVDMEKVQSNIDSVLKRQPIHVVAGVRGGCLQDLFLYTDEEKAKKKRKSILKDYGLSDKDKPDNQHSQECRWNSDNEIHLHTTELE